MSAFSLKMLQLNNNKFVRQICLITFALLQYYLYSYNNNIAIGNLYKYMYTG